MAVNTSAWHALTSASPVVQLTLLLLIGLSIYSWTIIFSKYKQLKNVHDHNDDFANTFWKAGSLDSIYDEVENYKNSPASQLFIAGYHELQKLAETSKKAGESVKPKLSGIDNLSRALNKSMDIEIAKLEAHLNFLATVSSNAPFIGLFGTVWGIMSSFQQIGATGSANLAVVAPGISEALIATAVGLATAIPAGAAYNFYLSQIRKLELDLTNFNADFLNIAKRNFFKGD